MASRNAARTVASPRWARSLVGAPSGPTDPATRTSRPATSRASRAIWAPRRASRPAWSARPYGARRTRLAPNVAVSIRSAPAARYSRWMAPISSGRDSDQLVERGTLRDAAREEQRAHRPVGQQRAVGQAFAEPGARIHARTIAGRALDRTPATAERQRAVRGEEHLRRPRPAVVGGPERRGVRAGIGDRDEVAAPERAAGRGRRGCRWTRRSAPRPAWRSGPADVAPPGVSAWIGCRAPYSAGRISSVMPGVEDDLAVAAVADVEDARDQPAGARDERPAGLDGEARRPAVGRDRLEQRRDLAGEALGRRRRLAERTDREAAADVERCRTSRSSRATARRRPAPAGPPRARRPRRRAATRRAGGCRAAGAGRPVRPRRRARSPARSRSRSCRTWSRRRRRPARPASRARRPG